MTPLLDVKNLRVTFPTRQGEFEAVRGVSFTLGKERLGIVGESGSGKSMTGRAILRLIRSPGRVEADKMELHGRDLLSMSEKEMQGVRGQKISMVMQDPKFSLNPVMTIADQIMEIYRFHTGASKKAAWAKAIEMLEAVSIRDPERVMRSYPHEMSGGMGQRIMIAYLGAGCVGANAGAVDHRPAGARTRNGTDFHQPRPEAGIVLLRPCADHVRGSRGRGMRSRQAGSGHPPLYPRVAGVFAEYP